MIPMLVACGDFSEKNANREYVNAAKRVASAEKAFNTADYALALELCSTAKSDVEKIVEKYPDTAVSLKIVSDGSMRIGSCKYVDLCDNIIPRLQLYTAPEMKPVDLAWVLAVDSNKYENLAWALIKNCKKIDSKIVGELIENAISKVNSMSAKRVLRDAYMSAMNVKTKPTEKPIMEANVAKKSVEKISDTKSFLRDARTASSLVSYDLNSINKLRDMSKLARNADNETRAQFASYLSNAYDNILKISTPSVREKAFSTMAIAFAYFGDELRAIATSQKITNESLFYEVFKAIGENASGGANYKETLTLASRLKDNLERSRFLSLLAIDVAKRGNFEGAKEIAAKVQDMVLKNAAYATIAKIAFDNEKYNEASFCISSIDVKNLDCLSVFDDGNLSPKIATSMRLATLSSKLVAHNPKLAVALNNLALSSLNAMKSHDASSGDVFKLVFDNFVKLDKADVALNFVMNLHRVNVSIFKDSLCELAMNSKNAELSKKAITLLADIYNASNNSIELAVLLAVNGVSREESVQILSSVLPKFAK